ncbi:hypothetical protein RJ55_06961 [Drechmeria coniospora]|nr:hypothetical protein RJ55_06961 [Drechmeria coniospora]
MSTQSDTNIHLIVAIPTLIGSLLSFLANFTALLLHILYPPQRHFRHALIVNLFIADLINSLNNTVSGFYFLARGYNSIHATPDAKCIANAWIGQLSVQAVDFNILIISIVVLLTVFNSHRSFAHSTLSTVLVCAAAWVPGLITSNIALGLDAYGYVSGNWCWIKADRLGLRYALTHGWRIIIFVATILIYTCIYIHLKRTFGKLRMSNNFSSSLQSQDRQSRVDLDRGSDTQEILVASTFVISHELKDQSHVVRHSRVMPDGSSSDQEPWNGPGQNHHQTRFEVSAANSNLAAAPRSYMAAPPNLRKMLLMNGYPIAYIILWLPGIANRLAESLGSTPRWLTILQCSTQFIGLVNALTYGLNEQMRQRISKNWQDKRGFSRA